MRGTTAWWTPAVAVLAVACGGGDRGTAGMVIDTVDGVPRITSTGDGAWAPDEAWHVGAGIRIGGIEGPEPSTFSNIYALAVDDGHIYVGDAQALEIRVFDRAGAFLHRFGRSGEGPGEFRGLDGLAIAPDGSVLARDPRLRRITRFTPEGDVIASFLIRRPFIQYSNGAGFRVTDDGRIPDYLLLATSVNSPDSLALTFWDVDGTEGATVLLGSVQRQSVMVTVGGVPSVSFPLPFSARGAWAVHPDGRIAWGLGDAYAFEIRSPDGRPVRRVARAVEPRRVAPDEAAAVAERLDERAREAVEGGRIESYDVPDTRPAFTHMAADASGHWWVGYADGWPGDLDPTTWDVFDGEGRFLGSVTLPEPIRVMTIGDDWIAGVARDELDVSYVVVWPLIKP